jgi:hypothetical protein
MCLWAVVKTGLRLNVSVEGASMMLNNSAAFFDVILMLSFDAFVA